MNYTNRILIVTFFSSLQFLQVAAEPYYFPKTFLKGVGLSAYQNGGDKWGTSNWSHFEKKTWLTRPSILENHQCQNSSGFWTHCHHDIKLLHELGCNALRFSIEWTAIEPSEGFFNEEALQFYEQFCDALLTAGITPMVTLHHFAHPHWFDEKGGFEREENIQYFVAFCIKVFERLSNKVHLWCTINEPTVYSFMGYILGMHSPGKFGKFYLAGMVLKNLLKAHMDVYHTLKKLPHGNQAQIGIVHQVLKAQSYYTWFLPSYIAARFLNFCAGHEVMMKFLESGTFDYGIPGWFSIKEHFGLRGLYSYDFIGLNYYSRVVVGMTGPTCYHHETMTDMEYPIYPAGIYETIVELSKLKVPIYITENGLADHKDDRRADFIKGYIHYVHKAISEGYDIRGYFYWTLMDNFEWDRGFTMKFGLYEVDRNTLQRTLREGSKTYRDIMQITA